MEGIRLLNIYPIIKVSSYFPQDLDPRDTAIFLLALYEKVTLSRASTLPAMQLHPSVCFLYRPYYSTVI